ncbi:VacJ family lipoprotein [Suttonella sp. R2A3]|uniref:MlaA family lipoprotein n=1 Tax=Suttonella sp. R2A3 TaxID=2908648 RepID=UPI001F1BFE6D|nr:VacJ family lipoprotein [Suttonella sp. R2A3]UJF23720.1 VacJ family lipoprotein [Suttonella sp. R2A3]
MTKLNLKHTLLCSSLIVLTACSSAIGPDGYTNDPWEPMNRGIFSFNETLDTALLKPIATGYDAVVPDPVQTGVSNFFGNIADMGAVVNSVLQFKFDQAAWGTARVINNTFFGLGGIFDVATPLGNNKIHADFSSTLAHYGVESGPYLVLPVLGPSTPRDAFGRLVDKTAIDPFDYVNSDEINWTAFALDGINTRARLLDLEQSMGDDVGDKYTLIRDSWIQHRWSRLNDGKRNASQQQAIDDVFESE